MTTIKEWAELAALLLSGSAVVAGIWRYGIRPLVRYVKHMSSVHALVESIHAEFRPNGGSTLKDQLNNITLRMNNMDASLMDIHSQRELILDSISKVEMTLFTFEQTYRIFSNLLPVGVFKTDETGGLVEVNLNLCRITGRTPEELLGAGWTSYISDAHRDLVIDEWGAAIKTKRKFEKRFDISSYRGEELPVHLVATPIKDRNNDVVGYFGYMEIFSEEK